MSISISDLITIVRKGGGINIDATKITVSDLIVIARKANGSGATIYIRNAAALSSDDLKVIASKAGGKVIFEI